MGVIEEILRLRDEASSELRKVAGEAGNTETAMDGLKRGAAAAGVGIGALAVTLQQTISYVVRARQEVEFLAGSTGASTRTIAGLGLALRASGRDIQDAEGAIKGFQGRLREVQQGSESTAQAFRDIGLSGASLASGDFDAALSLTIERLQAIDDDGERARATMATLGEEGTKLMAALGDQRLAEFVGQAERFGIEYGPDAIRVTREWNAALAETTQLAEGLAGAFTDRVLPALTSVTRQLNQGVVAAATELAAVVDSVAQAFVDQAGGANATGGSIALTAGGALLTGGASIGVPGLLAYGQSAGSSAARALAPTSGGGPSIFDTVRAALADEQARIGAAGGGTSGAGAGSGPKPGGEDFAALQKLSDTDFAALLLQRQDEEADARATVIEQIKADAIKRAEVEQAVIDAQQEAATALAAAAESNQRAADEAAAAARNARDARLAGVAGGINTASGLVSNLSGALPGVLASAGPYGAVAGAGLGLLTQLGQTGAEGVQEQVDILVKGIRGGLQALPDILYEVLPVILEAALFELPVALARAIADIIANPIKQVGRSFVPATQQFAQSLAEGGSSLDAFTQFGESVSGRDSNRSARRSGGRSLVVGGPITPRAADQLVDELNRDLGPRGRGLSFGGA